MVQDKKPNPKTFFKKKRKKLKYVAQHIKKYAYLCGDFPKGNIRNIFINRFNY